MSEIYQIIKTDASFRKNCIPIRLCPECIHPDIIDEILNIDNSSREYVFPKICFSLKTNELEFENVIFLKKVDKIKKSKTIEFNLPNDTILFL